MRPPDASRILLSIIHLFLLLSASPSLSSLRFYVLCSIITCLCLFRIIINILLFVSSSSLSLSHSLCTLSFYLSPSLFLPLFSFSFFLPLSFFIFPSASLSSSFLSLSSSSLLLHPSFPFSFFLFLGIIILSIYNDVAADRDVDEIQNLCKLDYFKWKSVDAYNILYSTQVTALRPTYRHTQQFSKVILLRIE